MRRRGKAIAITTIVTGLAVLVGAGFAAKDRIREAWWLHKLKNGDEEEKREAATTLAQMHSVRAVDVLVEGLGEVRIEFEDEPPVLIGVNGEETLSFQVEPPGDPLSRLEYRGEALAEIGAPAIPALREAFEKDKGPQRPYIAEILGAMGAEAGDAVPMLSRAFRDRADPAFYSAGWALGSIGVAAVPALLAAVTEEDRDVRWHASNLLAEIGPAANASQVIPVMIELLDDGDVWVRSNAARVIGTFGPQATAAIPALKKVLQDKKCRFIRQEVANTLAKIKTGAADAGEER